MFKEFQHIQEVEQIAINLTDNQIQTFIEAKCKWAKVEEIRSSRPSCVSAALFFYAGENPMKNCDDRVQYGGLDGALQVIGSIYDPLTHKKTAGGWLVGARWNRARGDIKAAMVCLDKAASHRLTAHKIQEGMKS